jgi:hypothetical protein
MRRENAKSSDAINDTESAEEGSFFRRWSSRKRRARREHVDDSPAQATAEASAVTENDAPAAPERVLTDEDMPPLESLNEDSDYSGFLSPGVSESLRKLALRKMFLSSKYNVTDGLDDYAEDFTQFEPLGNIITSDMRHQMEMQAERAKQKLEDEARAAMDGVPAGEDREAGPVDVEAPAGEPGEREIETVVKNDSKSGESLDQPSIDDDSRSG